MRVTILCDDRWHPARTARAGLALLEDTYELDWIEDAAGWSPARMAGRDLLLLTKSNNVSATDHAPWADDAAQNALAGFVRAGGGLLVLHSGSAGYADAATLRAISGGTFVSHPPQCAVEIRPRSAHPICRGAERFEVLDEHYIMQLDDPTADVFLETASQHGTQPGGWTRREGNGRVCVLTPGHTLEVLLHPGYQRLIRNALDWCAGS